MNGFIARQWYAWRPGMSPADNFVAVGEMKSIALSGIRARIDAVAGKNGTKQHRGAKTRLTNRCRYRRLRAAIQAPRIGNGSKPTLNALDLPSPNLLTAGRLAEETDVDQRNWNHPGVHQHLRATGWRTPCHRRYSLTGAMAVKRRCTVPGFRHSDAETDRTGGTGTVRAASAGSRWYFR